MEKSVSACSSMIWRRTCWRCRRFCSGRTWRPHSFATGSEALELLLVHDIALALLDVQMPQMDGFELAELMRGSERTRQIRSSSSPPVRATSTASSRI